MRGVTEIILYDFEDRFLIKLVIVKSFPFYPLLANLDRRGYPDYLKDGDDFSISQPVLN